MNKRAFDNRSRAAIRRDTGMTLIELMVALAIGSFLMIGAVTVFTQSRTTFRVNESISRLQENARFVFDTVEPDVRMSHYWGLSTRSNRIEGRATQLQPASPPAVAGDCNTNWTIDLSSDVEGSNNGYTWTCAPYMGAASPTADTLVVRRASEQVVTGALDANRLYIQSARVVASQLFQGSPAPVLTGASETHALVVNGYYVSPTSTLSTPGNQIPSLRMKTLVSGGAGPQIVDQEVLPGVEDMQVQFGVDTDNPGTANRGSVDRYVNPDDPILDPTSASFLPNAEILAVRLWFRLRAERPENGFTDTTNYVYADQNVPAPGDSFRRTVVSKTIYLRNARPPS